MNGRLFLWLILIGPWLPIAAGADRVNVAVATNFVQPMKVIANAFRQQTGHRVRLVSGSSGKLYAQIMNGAPYQVFLSADSDKPDRLVQNNRAEPATRFTYAMGSLVLWSASDKRGRVDADSIRQQPFRHLAIANARLAPYGKAAVEVLRKLDLWEEVRDRIVTGENIAQTYQFVSGGNAEYGFVALSQVIKDGEISKGAGWVVPQAYHDPIRQDAVLLDKGANNPAAVALMDFLKSDTAFALMKQHGYHR